MSRYSILIGPRVIDWRAPGYDPRDNPGVRQARLARGRLAGEGRQYATDDPCLFVPGDIFFFGSFMTDWTRAITDHAHGAVITIHVTAGAKKSVWPAGYHEWRNAIGCSVTAPAVGGKANRAVLDAISEACAIPLNRLSIVGGSTSPQKRILVADCSRQDLIVTLSPLFQKMYDEGTR